MCLRMGFTALRRIARMLHWNFEADPSPEGDLQLTYEEFVYAVQLVRETGFPSSGPNEEAWPHFRGWRVNYEALAYRMADVVVAPRAPWSGERRHLPLELMAPNRPPHRSPDGKVFYDQKHRPRHEQACDLAAMARGRAHTLGTALEEANHTWRP